MELWPESLWLKDDAMAVKVLEETERSLDFNVTRSNSAVAESDNYARRIFCDFRYSNLTNMNFDYRWVPFFLFIIEQIVMIDLGSYPYVWGLPIARIILPNNLRIEDVGGFFGRIKMEKDQEGNIFMRYKHYPLTWGPYVLVGQAKKENPTELIIRIGPLTCLFFASFIAEGLFIGLFPSIWSLIVVGSFIGYFYYSFLRGFEKIEKRM